MMTDEALYNIFSNRGPDAKEELLLAIAVALNSIDTRLERIAEIENEMLTIEQTRRGGS